MVFTYASPELSSLAGFVSWLRNRTLRPKSKACLCIVTCFSSCENGFSSVKLEFFIYICARQFSVTTIPTTFSDPHSLEPIFAEQRTGLKLNVGRKFKNCYNFEKNINLDSLILSQESFVKRQKGLQVSKIQKLSKFSQLWNWSLFPVVWNTRHGSDI